MIIWINGAFGAGKSQTAYELHRRTVNSYVYVPENAGYFIQDTDNMSVKENAEYIASMSNISLLPDNRGSLKRVYDRVITQVKQIRF